MNNKVLKRDLMVAVHINIFDFAVEHRFSCRANEPGYAGDIYLSVYPIVLGTVGAPHDVATNIRHSSHSSALLTASLSSKTIQSRMLSSHRFLCLPLLLPSRTVPWRTVLASPEALVTCPYHFILRLFTVDKSSL